MVADALSPAEQAMALAELDRIEATLGQMSGWLDDHGLPEAAVFAEEGWKIVLALARLIEIEPGRAASLVHRRNGPRRTPASPDGHH